MKIQGYSSLVTFLAKTPLYSTCLSGTPGFVPPVANFDGDATDGAIIAPPAPANKTKKGNGTPQKTPVWSLWGQKILMRCLFREWCDEEEESSRQEFLRRQLSAGRNNRGRWNSAGKTWAFSEICTIFFFNLTKANDSCACAQGAAGEGEGKREGGCTWSESGFIQTVLQGAGCGGAECAAVWPAQLLTAGLWAAHQCKRRMKIFFYKYLKKIDFLKWQIKPRIIKSIKITVSYCTVVTLPLLQPCMCNLKSSPIILNVWGSRGGAAGPCWAGLSSWGHASKTRVQPHLCPGQKSSVP